MSRKTSNLSQIDPRAEFGDDVEIGPFCVIGPNVRIGDGCHLDSHVTVVGHTTIGKRNRFFPNCVIGAEPQDASYRKSVTQLEIGDNNIFREGVTVNRGAEKEDRCTRVGNWNMLMSNSHVAHNCHIANHAILVNGVLLGGHVHVHEGAIVSGNTVVHHFSTLGTLSFVSGGSKVVTDIPPYMLASGNDNLTIKMVNIVGLKRAGIPDATIKIIKHAHRLMFRKHTKLSTVRAIFRDELDGNFPLELTNFLDFIERQQQGKLGRAREIQRENPQKDDQVPQRRVA